jgi:hypothetical protein
MESQRLVRQKEKSPQPGPKFPSEVTCCFCRKLSGQLMKKQKTSTPSTKKNKPHWSASQLDSTVTILLYGAPFPPLSSHPQHGAHMAACVVPYTLAHSLSTYPSVTPSAARWQGLGGPLSGSGWQSCAHTSFLACGQLFDPWGCQCQPAFACLSVLHLLKGRADLKQTASTTKASEVMLTASGVW